MIGTSVRKQRKLLLSKYGDRYERHFSSRPGCFYCGDIASTIDHCPPLSFCDVKDEKWFKDKKIKFYTVACCKECNQKLASRPILTLRERAEYILNVLEKKTDQLVVWTEDEIMEMSKVFERSIRARKKQHDIIFDRVRFCQELMYRAEDLPEELE